MAITNLNEKFQHELGDAYDAEHRLMEAMQEMSQMASDTKLKGMIEQHITETQRQIGMLEQVYQAVGMQPKRVACDAAIGLVKEGQKTVQEAQTPELRDCVIAGALAKGEHYEMAGYRGLVMGAQQMGNQEVQQMLQQILMQEEKTAQLLEQSAPMLLQKAATHQRQAGR
jgi:ferritin-like metal-binding protein YciE